MSYIFKHLCINYYYTAAAFLGHLIRCLILWFFSCWFSTWLHRNSKQQTCGSWGSGCPWEGLRRGWSWLHRERGRGGRRWVLNLKKSELWGETQHQSFNLGLIPVLFTSSYGARIACGCLWLEPWWLEMLLWDNLSTKRWLVIMISMITCKLGGHIAAY